MKLNDLLEAHAADEVMRTVTQASTLPPTCYTSQAWYDLEVRRMWRSNWLVIGRLDEVPKIGDYQRVDIVGEPLIIIRGQDGIVRVLSAICRHRGCVLKEGCGNARALSCPYHGWTYNLSGSLISVPGMEEAENFRLADYSLIPVATATWGGFIFANLDSNAAPMMDSLGDLAKRFDSHRMGEMRVTRKVVNNISANWKIWLENSRDGYHAGIVHAKTYQKFFAGREEGQWRYVGKEGVYEILSGSNDDGLYLPVDPPFDFVPGLSQEDKDSTHFAIYYPHLLLNVAPSHMAIHQLFPLAPDKTTVVTWFCFPESTVARADFNEEVKRYYEIVDAFIPEDIVVANLTQKGLSGHLARPGRFSIHERPCHAFSKWLVEQLQD